MQRRTKIIATLGPATDDQKVLQRVIRAGVDLVRVNFSHGTMETHQKRVDQVRKTAAGLKRVVGVIGDLQGPKIRISKFSGKKAVLVPGKTFVLDVSPQPFDGNEKRVGVDYKDLNKDVLPGDTLLLDDGKIELLVDRVKDTRICCQVIVGGVLSDNKGINRMGGGLSAGSLTGKDKRDLKHAKDLNLDYVALSFTKTAQDVHDVRRLLKKAKSPAGIIAKMERAEALLAMEEIIAAADGIMVARGDLALEIGPAEVPAIQKKLISQARSMNKPVITATQMMESMIQSAVPTRAEVSDVANAVMDNTDAVMMSAETAVGLHPDRVISAAADICSAIEKHPGTRTSGHRLSRHFERVDEVIAMAAVYVANHMDIKAIVAFTETGTTPLWMSRIRTGIPIFGLSRHQTTLGKMTLFRNVHPLFFDSGRLNWKETPDEVLDLLRQHGVIDKKDHILITKGDRMGVLGRTNSIEIFGGKMMPVPKKENQSVCC